MPARCGKDDPSAEVVRLWDGRDYCRGCVEAECPTLWEFARGRDVLEDAIPHDPKGGLSGSGRWPALFGGGSFLVGAGFWAAGEPILAISLGGAIVLVTTLSTLAMPPGRSCARIGSCRRSGSVPGRSRSTGSAEPGQSSFFSRGAQADRELSRSDSAHWHVGRLRRTPRAGVRGPRSSRTGRR